MDEGQRSNTSFRSAQNVAASSHYVRSERSPLHDVRQHAQARSARGGRRMLVRISFTDEPGGSFSDFLPSVACEASRKSGCDLLVDRIAAGGARRDRTDDLLLAKQALSQLSYGPAVRYPSKGGKWWAWEDLNFRPHAYQARALTN